MSSAELVDELLLFGCTTGFLAGLLGIGGGMLMVPLLTLILSQHGVPIGTAVKMAIATSMATILFTSISSVRAHHARRAVRWDIVRAMALGIAAGGLLAGAGIFALLKGDWLALVFAGFGFLSGLVGAGGGFISVPFMTWCNIAIHNAVATSAALGFPIALANTLGYVVSGWSLPAAMSGAIGYLYLPALAIVGGASVLLAPLGARAAHAMNVVLLRRMFALLLFTLSARTCSTRPSRNRLRPRAAGLRRMQAPECRDRVAPSVAGVGRAMRDAWDSNSATLAYQRLLRLASGDCAASREMNKLLAAWDARADNQDDFRVAASHQQVGAATASQFDRWRDIAGRHSGSDLNRRRHLTDKAAKQCAI